MRARAAPPRIAPTRTSTRATAPPCAAARTSADRAGPFHRTASARYPHALAAPDWPTVNGTPRGSPGAYDLMFERRVSTVARLRVRQWGQPERAASSGAIRPPRRDARCRGTAPLTRAGRCRTGTSGRTDRCAGVAEPDTIHDLAPSDQCPLQDVGLPFVVGTSRTLPPHTPPGVGGHAFRSERAVAVLRRAGDVPRLQRSVLRVIPDAQRRRHVRDGAAVAFRTAAGHVRDQFAPKDYASSTGRAWHEVPRPAPSAHARRHYFSRLW